MVNIAILGSTGSIGRQTLEIAAEMPDRVHVVGLAANRNRELLTRQISQFRPRYRAIADETVDAGPGIGRGIEALVEMATAPEVDLLVVAIVGSGGLLPTVAALEAKKGVALANKETLVMAGPIITRQLQAGGRLVPIDSEHSAIWQCLQGEPKQSVEKMVLTASGGAFRDLPVESLASVTPQQALRHPTWKMGPKVTVDSANLMNKGLELIEASLLFDLCTDQIEVLMHRESIVHSLVYFKDSSVKAQMGLPDMRLPIQYALGHPDRWDNQLPRLDLRSVGGLHFEPVDLDRHPCLQLARLAGERGGTYPAALCAADEMAVAGFIQGELAFTDIPQLIETVMEDHNPSRNPSLDDILETDATVRAVCRRILRDRTGGGVPLSKT